MKEVYEDHNLIRVTRLRSKRHYQETSLYIPFHFKYLVGIKKMPGFFNLLLNVQSEVMHT